MTELEIWAFVALPLGIALFGWVAVLGRERRTRKSISEAVKGRSS
jgi:hypothetical protein